MITNSCVVLNSTHEPLNITPTKRALLLCLKEKARPIKYHDHVMRSESKEHALPSTIIMNYYVKTRKIYNKKAALTQRNLFARDGHTCQYCGRGPSQFNQREFLTRDHIHPRALGGKNIWSNVVTCCSSCNNKKGDLTLNQCEFILRVEPYAPTLFELFAKSKVKHFKMENLYS